MKPGSYTQLYIQLVLAPKYRQPLLKKEYRETIFRYMSGNLTNKGHKSIIINGVSDHVHVLVGLNPTISISDLVRDLKRSTSLFINEKEWFSRSFHWQNGYGAFSYSRSHLSRIYRYIENQEMHHGKITFREEYLEFLRKYKVEFGEQFLFDFDVKE